jgi:hypothetical protein
MYFLIRAGKVRQNNAFTAFSSIAKIACPKIMPPDIRCILKGSVRK